MEAEADGEQERDQPPAPTRKGRSADGKSALLERQETCSKSERHLSYGIVIT